jgi:predicted hotdog family 3-hydroxylacyl-ACP dehydratase
MKLDRGWIEARIPHAGRMCLLDEVIDFDAERIRCATDTHRAPDHPLRARGRLGIACGIELAAQAMALHGALIAEDSGARPSAGLLAALRGVRTYALRLDDIASSLVCEAVRVAGDASTALYDFTLRSADARLMSGRATVVLDVAAARAGPAYAAPDTDRAGRASARTAAPDRSSAASDAGQPVRSR